MLPSSSLSLLCFSSFLAAIMFLTYDVEISTLGALLRRDLKHSRLSFLEYILFSHISIFQLRLVSRVELSLAAMHDACSGFQQNPELLTCMLWIPTNFYITAHSPFMKRVKKNSIFSFPLKYRVILSIYLVRGNPYTISPFINVSTIF